MYCYFYSQLAIIVTTFFDVILRRLPAQLVNCALYTAWYRDFNWQPSWIWEVWKLCKITLYTIQLANILPRLNHKYFVMISMTNLVTTTWNFAAKNEFSQYRNGSWRSQPSIRMFAVVLRTNSTKMSGVIANQDRLMHYEQVWCVEFTSKRVVKS